MPTARPRAPIRGGSAGAGLSSHGQSGVGVAGVQHGVVAAERTAVDDVAFSVAGVQLIVAIAGVEVVAA